MNAKREDRENEDGVTAHHGMSGGIASTLYSLQLLGQSVRLDIEQSVAHNRTQQARRARADVQDFFTVSHKFHGVAVNQ